MERDGKMKRDGKPEHMPKIIIVGGGIGGLSAGIYGKLAGYDVDIYEKNPVAGGQCIGWNRKGHHIDNCIHWLTGTKEGTAMNQVWKTLGAITTETKYVSNGAFFTSCYEGQRATLWTDLERTERELIQLSPVDEEEIKKFIQHVRYAFCCTIPAKMPMDFMSIRDYMQMGKEMADMPKVMKTYGNVSLREVADRFQHPLLKRLITDYLPEQYCAYSFLVSYATMASGNGEIPAGGSLAMTNRMVQRFLELGGNLHLGQPVKRIVIEKNRATGIELEGFQIKKGDYVITAVDTMELFSNLIGKEFMCRELEYAYDNMEQYPLFSGLQFACSVSKEDYTETGTVFFDCEPFTIGGREISRMSVKGYEYEESFAPKGKIVLQVNVSQFDRDFLYWKQLSKEQYKEEKARLCQIVQERLVKQFPKLEKQFEILDCWTPLTYERYCNAYHGAYMSFMSKPGVKQVKINGKVKGIKGLYVAGQWIMSPGGLPIAAISGKFAIQRIMKQEGREWRQLESC